MKTTRYFVEQVMPRRPYATEAMCEAVLARPLRRVVQADGRIRLWGEILLPGEARMRYLRVVTLADGETVHNAFLDRDYLKDGA